MPQNRFSMLKLPPMRILLLIPALILSIPFALAANKGDNMVIIANPSTSTNAVSQSEARLIFSNDIKAWKSGEQIAVITMRRTDDAYSRFTQEVLNLYPYQIERAINRKRYAGTAQSEIVAVSAEEMLKLVASIPGAIGYIHKKAASNMPSIKILEVRNE